MDQALIDLIRVGLTNNGSGVRQLARRLLRRPPTALRKRDALQQALALTLSQTETPALPLREEPGSDPWDGYEGPTRLARRRRPAAPKAAWEDGTVALERVAIDAVDEPLLSGPTRGTLDRLLLEHLEGRLEAAGLQPTRTVLLLGPPGVGKTMTAAWLAHKLKRPLLRLDLAGLMSAELGGSGRMLRATVRAAASQDAVLLLDELDAIARTRGEGQDVGEARRLVNVLLLELDAWPAKHVLVAATNHADLLDPAVRRRFELTLTLSLPDRETRLWLMERALPDAAVDGTLNRVLYVVVDLTAGWSHSDVRRLVIRAQRDAVTTDAELCDHLLQVLAEEVGDDRTSRDALSYALVNVLGLSDREAARRLGVSHPTVAAGANRHASVLAPQAAERRQ